MNSIKQVPHPTSLKGLGSWKGSSPLFIPDVVLVRGQGCPEETQELPKRELLCPWTRTEPMDRNDTMDSTEPMDQN